MEKLLNFYSKYLIFITVDEANILKRMLLENIAKYNYLANKEQKWFKFVINFYHKILMTCHSYKNMNSINDLDFLIF
jgi:hypothetical protein